MQITVLSKIVQINWCFALALILKLAMMAFFSVHLHSEALDDYVCSSLC